jgi:death-on-curing protein
MNNAPWIWISLAVAEAVHAEQIAEHGGGGDALRDRGLFESAMARPQQLAHYGDPDAASLAAAYAYGLARNHPFVDGNKRIAAVISETFLTLNGYNLVATDAELVVAFLELASGDMSQEDVADWFRQHVRPA